MSSFTRTLIFGLAALGMIVIGGLFAAILFLNLHQDWRQAARAMLLSAEERRQLEELANRPDEPPLIRTNRPVDVEETVAAITEQLSRGQVRDLYQELQRSRRILDEQRQQLEQERAELRLAQADLVRLQTRIGEEERALASRIDSFAAERSEWARKRVEEARQVQVLDDVEKANKTRLARMYQVNKAEETWAQLRKLPTDEVAVLLSLMDQKKAAKVMAAAVADDDFPLRSVELHRAMLSVDLDGRSGDQVARLARLYADMKVDELMPYLEGETAKDLAALLLAMEGEDQQVAAVLRYLREAGDPREIEVHRLMLEAGREVVQ